MLYKKYNGIAPIFKWLNGLNVEIESRYPSGYNKDGNNLTSNQQKIVNQIKINPKISDQKIFEIIGMNRRNTEGNLTKLKDLNILKRVGGTRGHWEIIDV